MPGQVEGLLGWLGVRGPPGHVLPTGLGGHSGDAGQSNLKHVVRLEKGLEFSLRILEAEGFEAAGGDRG